MSFQSFSSYVSQPDSNVCVCVSAKKMVSSELGESAAPVTRSRRRVALDASVIPHVSSLIYWLPLKVFFPVVGCFDPVCSSLDAEL